MPKNFKWEIGVPDDLMNFENNKECTRCFSEGKDTCGTRCYNMCATSDLYQHAMVVVVLDENSGCVSITFVSTF